MFEPGTLETAFYSVLGEEVGRTSLQAADPREVVRLGEAVAAAKEAFRASVHLRDGQNNDLGTLGYVILRPG